MFNFLSFLVSLLPFKERDFGITPVDDITIGIIIIIIIIILSSCTNKITVNIHHGENHQVFYEDLGRIWTDKFFRSFSGNQHFCLPLVASIRPAANLC